MFTRYSNIILLLPFVVHIHGTASLNTRWMGIEFRRRRPEQNTEKFSSNLRIVKSIDFTAVLLAESDDFFSATFWSVRRTLFRTQTCPISPLVSRHFRGMIYRYYYLYFVNVQHYLPFTFIAIFNLDRIKYLFSTHFVYGQLKCDIPFVMK